MERYMSDNIPFPYVSYKGKKYADPHAAAKAFFLDTTKTPTDRLNIHDISDTSSIDGAGVDRNGKVWINSESFQNHPSMINLKTAMKDVFDSIKEVMKRDNATLEQVAQKPLDVRPYYSYKGKRYETPQEVFTEFNNDPNKVENSITNNVMYHNRYDVAGIELAGAGPNQTTWYTRMSDYANIPAVKAGRAIFEQMKQDSQHLTNNVEVETPVVSAPKVESKGIILDAANPIIDTKDYNLTQMNAAEFPVHFSYNRKAYLHAEDAMKAFLDTPKEERLSNGNVMLHTKYIGAGFDMAGQTPTHGQQLWVDRLGNNDHVPEVVAARKVMNEMLKEHNLKNQPVEPQVEVKVNPLTAENPIMTKKDFYAKLDSQLNITEPHFSLNDNVYLHAKDAMKAYLDMSQDERAKSMGVTLHTRDVVIGYQMAGQTHTHGQQLWVDRLMDNDHVPEVVAARKVMNEMLNEHKLKNQPVEPAIVAAPKVAKVEEETSPRIMINAENPIVSRKDLDYGAISNSPKFPIHYTYGDTAYLHAKDAMEAFMNDPNKVPHQNGVTLHTRYTTAGFQMTGVDQNNEVWVDRLMDNDTVPAVVAARAVMNKILNDAAPKDEINFTPVAEASKQPEFPYFKYDNKVYTSASDVMKVFIADRDNNSIKSTINLHVDNHFNSVEAAGHERNGDVWRNQYSFQDHPAMQDLKKSFDKEVNGYKAHLQYLDAVYADNAKVVDGYPREVQIEDMKEMKKIIDKLPIHNISDTDMIKIQSYKNDIKNHELSVFLDDGTKNNDVKVKNNNTLKIS